MSELSNVVTVLIARMESHPDDFSLYAPYRAKFADVAEALYALAGVDESKNNRYWYLTDADKEALLEAWKKYHRKALEKSVMEAIFDDGEGERELAKVNQQMYQAQQRAMIKNQMMQSTGTYQPLAQSTTIAPGQFHPLQNNVATNSASGFLGGIFGSSK